ncbi:MAG TPA: AMP-binding protein, partial [Solirubrobacter sp.]|nr:AMP-binding protein [Solirubrobacter sp.]
MPGDLVARARRDTMGDLLYRSAARYPDRIAVAYEDLRVSYAELDETANRVANALAERGVRKGDRLALLSRNSYAFVAAYFASARLGS